jgi:hypothetical protein
MAAPSAVYPVSRRFIAVGKEVTPGTAVAPTATLPMTSFEPEDKVVYLPDESWRNAMAAVYAEIEGVESGEISMGGPFFGDTIGYPLLNVMGDYYQSVTGTAGTPTTVATGTPYVAGSATLTLTAATGFSTGTTFAVGALGTTAEEVRTVTSIAGAVVTLNAPMYQNHAGLVPVTPYTVVTTYNHFFSLLNSGTGAGGSPQAQPPTYTYYDYTGMTTTVGARCYPSTCVSELSFTGAAEALLMWDAKATSFVSQPASTAPTASVSAVIPQADWHAQIGIGGTVGSNPVSNAKEWKISIARKLAPYWTNQGSQNPYVIGRGTLDLTGSLTFDPSYDESQLLDMLNNSQPQLQIIAVNGLAGAAAVTLTINIQVAAYETAKITSSGELFGHDITFRAVANTTNIGPSGGYSPALIEVSNAVVNYG